MIHATTKALTASHFHLLDSVFFMEDQSTCGYVLIAFERSVARHLETVAATLARCSIVFTVGARVTFEVSSGLFARHSTSSCHCLPHTRSHTMWPYFASFVGCVSIGRCVVDPSVHEFYSFFYVVFLLFRAFGPQLRGPKAPILFARGRAALVLRCAALILRRPLCSF